jgi:3-oxoadipate enol-lactonase
MTHLDIDGVRLHYEVQGPDRAPVLVLAHALGTDLHMWDAQMGAFLPRFRVVRYDCRGHGESDAPPGPYSIEDLANDAIGLLDALGIERACICGLSLGGLVALRIATASPDRLERAVFACTAARIGTPELWDERIELVRNGGMGAVTDMLVERYFSKRFRDSRPEAVGQAVRTVESTSPEGYIACCSAVRNTDLRDRVASIRVPSLIVGATEDVATPPSDSEWLHAQIPDSKLIILEGVAHLSSVEQSQRFGDAVLDFLGHPGSSDD